MFLDFAFLKAHRYSVEINRYVEIKPTRQQYQFGGPIPVIHVRFPIRLGYAKKENRNREKTQSIVNKITLRFL